MRSRWLAMMVLCAPEQGADAGGGSGGGAPPGESGGPPSSGAPPADDAGGEKKTEAPTQRSSGLTPDQLRSKLAEQKTRAKAKADGAEPKAETPDELAALREQNAALAERLAKIEGQQRDVTLRTALEAAQIKPAYHALAKLELGDVDVSTDAGRAKIDAWAKAHPEVLTSYAPATTPGPQSQWIDQTLNADKKRQTLAAVMPRGFLEGAVATLVKE